MEQELMEKVIELLPKIKDKRTYFSEKELVVIKAAFEAITGIKVTSMMSCGGQLCEDFRRSIVNYMNSYKHVKTEAPKKTVVSKPVSPSGNRDNLMAQALKIAEDKGIKKPHHKSGEDKLQKYILNNGK